MGSYRYAKNVYVQRFNDKRGEIIIWGKTQKGRNCTLILSLEQALEVWRGIKQIIEYMAEKEENRTKKASGRRP